MTVGSGFENDLVFAANADFSGASNPEKSNGLQINGQLWIGTTALNAGGTHINVGTITSPSGTITIGYSSPNITIDLTGGFNAIEKINLQTGTTPIVPSSGAITFNGATVLAGTNPVRTDGTSPNTMALEVQISQAIAATDATKIGLAAFNNTEFTVDANGFVSLIGGGLAIDSIQVDANTAPGTNPVLPTVAGLITITGAQVATGTIGANVIRTDSLAANAFTIEIQRTTAVAAADSTKNGVSHFNSAQFTVDANGFVSTNGNTVKWNVINQGTQPANFVVNNGYICQAGGTGNVSIALPTTSVLGDIIEIVLDGATKWTITQGAGQSIRFSNSVTTVGVGGSITTTGTGDAVRMVCETANLRWLILSAVGNLTVT